MRCHLEMEQGHLARAQVKEEVWAKALDEAERVEIVPVQGQVEIAFARVVEQRLRIKQVFLVIL